MERAAQARRRAAAFDQLAREHLPRLYRLGLGFCGNHADAQDLAQETLLQAFRKWGNWGLGALVNVLFNGAYTDLCYGYHAFWRHCLPTIDRTIADGFEVDTAIYIRLLSSSEKS